MSAIPINMFSGSPLNRLSWLRPFSPFLNALIVSPATRWVVFKAGEPLVTRRDEKQIPVILETRDVRPFLGPEPFFGQGKGAGELLTEEQRGPATEAARHIGIPVVFLGLHEKVFGETVLPESDIKDPHETVAKLPGTPYFSLDVADLELSEEELANALKGTSVGQSGQVLEWTEPRSLMMGLDATLGSIYAQARSMTDWNYRNKYCPGCGSRVYSLWAGWKLSCSSLLPWAEKTNKKPCPTVRGLHNFAHPRTDAVVIMIAIDETGDNILLGRGKRFPGNFYSALAGFIEPGEAFEDSVAREMWEEAGVKVWDVRYHSTQPWPYPANLMVGFYSRADSSQPIRTDLDHELVDARWFTREEVTAVLDHAAGKNMTKSEYKKFSDLIEGKDNQHKEKLETGVLATAKDAPPFRVPPATAIAGAGNTPKLNL
ncbi:hypothetical protein AX16_000907 [Volvariella volvacea WC 439]|nr:hypothetical protein AX16_000907 [Volvariella volvacea WC 439]